jgi:hypothetical protein
MGEDAKKELRAVFERGVEFVGRYGEYQIWYGTDLLYNKDKEKLFETYISRTRKSYGDSPTKEQKGLK